MYTCNASATAAVDGARTDMHLPSFKLQHTQHILHIASVPEILETQRVRTWRLKE